MGKTLIGTNGLPGQPSGPKKTYITNINGKDGQPGENAYQIALDNGFEGSELEWLESLDGLDGTDAYTLALLEGFIGSRAEWLDSLKGEKGDSAYEVAQSAGFPGTKEQWLDSLEGNDGEDGFSPYLSKTATHIQVQYFTIDGEPASELIDLLPLSEIAGKDGRDSYLIAVANGFTGTETEWIVSLRGLDGYTPVLTLSATHIQVHYTRGEEETDPEDLISLENLTGNTGKNGGTPKLRKTITHFQWGISFDDADPEEWFNLASIEELKGSKGDKGDPGESSGLWFAQSSAGHYETVVPSIHGNAYRPTTSGSIVHPIYIPEDRVYDRFVIRCTAAQAGGTMSFVIYRWNGVVWKYINVGLFDMSVVGLREISGRWTLPRGRYVFAFGLMSGTYNFTGGVPSNVSGFPYGAPSPNGTANMGDTRLSTWWAHPIAQLPATDLQSFDVPGLSAAGITNSPNAWGAGHPPNLYGRTAV